LRLRASGQATREQAPRMERDSPPTRGVQRPGGCFATFALALRAPRVDCRDTRGITEAGPSRVGARSAEIRQSQDLAADLGTGCDNDPIELRSGAEQDDRIVANSIVSAGAVRWPKRSPASGVLSAQSGEVDGQGEMRVSSPSGARRLRSTGGGQSLLRCPGPAVGVQAVRIERRERRMTRSACEDRPLRCRGHR
jgi:hypothetical protein